ncbi:PQQ-binding-like beta-propeller repeat protein, partial [candidate division KSB1 bacterium]|nr:PQQ-binding-like beta-propeller repeat protein [candidate division KSB1 bacterium]
MKVNLFMIFLLCAVSAFAGVSSQWRGPERTGIYTEKNLLQQWPAEGPQLLWTAEGLGTGHSSAAVTDNIVYISTMIDGQGLIFAFDINGKQLWKKNYAKEWNESHPGTHSTPTIYDGRL